MVKVWLLATTHVNEHIRYEPEERPPLLVTVGAGFQAAALTLAPVALTEVIVARIAGHSRATRPGPSLRRW